MPLGGMAIGGMNRRMGTRIGSVISCRKITTGLRVHAHPEKHNPDEDGDHQYDGQNLNEAAGDFYEPSLPRSILPSGC